MIATHGSRLSVTVRLANGFPEFLTASGLEYDSSARWARKTSAATDLPAGNVSDGESSVGVFSICGRPTNGDHERYFVALQYRRRSRHLAERVRAILLESGAETVE